MKSVEFNYIPLFVIAIPLMLFVALTSIHSDGKIWDEVIEHSDEFVLDHVNKDYATFKLYDKDSVYVCEVFLTLYREKAVVVKDGTVIASSGGNTPKSRKAFKVFYKMIPQDKIPKYPTKKEVLEKLKNM